MKVYIIQEVGYDYDDEYYRRPECGGGIPAKAFLNKEKAVEVCNQMDNKALKAADLDDYYRTPTFFEVVEVTLID